MKSLMYQFWSEDGGQDLIEYTLLLAFVCLVAAAIFINAGNSASGIWLVASSHLSVANSRAS